VIFSRCQIPNVMPTAAPRITKTARVPSLLSSQYPSKGGSTISIEIVVIRDVHSMAVAIDDRSGGLGPRMPN